MSNSILIKHLLIWKWLINILKLIESIKENYIQKIDVLVVGEMQIMRNIKWNLKMKILHIWESFLHFSSNYKNSKYIFFY